MQTKRTISFITAMAGLVWLLTTAIAAEAPKVANPKPADDADPFPITVTVAPSVVLASTSQADVGKAGSTLTITGTTLPAGERTVAVSIKSDANESLATQQVKVDAKGNYLLSRAAPSKPGTYEVTATAPDGRGAATATFRAIGSSNISEQTESTMQEAIVTVDQSLTAAEKQIDAQVDSPPKAAAKQKLSAARKAVAALRTSESSGVLRGTIGAIASDAALMESMRPKFANLTAAVNDTATETARVKELTAKMSSADIGCHQLAFVTEVFKGISALLNVKKRVLDTTLGLAKDVVADATGNVSKGSSSASGRAFVSGQIVKNFPELNRASALAGNAYSIMADVGAFVSDTLFGKYCEQFVGPIEGIMNAQFFAARGGNGPTLWWTYNYKITGRVTLYYPKSAKGGTSIRLNGRIEGYAHDFATEEDALTVLFPKLMAGAQQYKKSFPPVEVGAAASKIASQGSSPMSAYLEGSAAGLLVPNSFLISVTGVLEKDSLTVLLGAAQSDISPVHRVTVLILSPLTGGLGPQVTWYPLPFGKVRSFLVNAADGESMKLTLKTQGDKMTADQVFTGKVVKPKAHGDYTVKMKVCNPGC